MATKLGEKTVPLILDEEEKDLLLAILRAELTETVDEARRTETPLYKEEVLRREVKMKELIKRIEMMRFDV